MFSIIFDHNSVLISVILVLKTFFKKHKWLKPHSYV